MSILEVPLCYECLRQLETFGAESIPDRVWACVGLEACGILRARSPRTAGGGRALGVQCVYPEECCWCGGPESPDDSFLDMEERPGGTP